MRVAPHNQLATKWERLDLHHVRFQSCGGADTEDNLVPLCPNCHTTLHEARRRGEVFVSDDELLAMWKLWKDLPGNVLHRLQVGTETPVCVASIELDIYGLEVEAAVDAASSYAQFRGDILNRIITVLRLHDPHFPFGPRSKPEEWLLSSDEHAATPWNTVRASAVLASYPKPLRIGYEEPFLLTRDAAWLAGADDRNRWL
jgi:hypothetical protein